MTGVEPATLCLARDAPPPVAYASQLKRGQARADVGRSQPIIATVPDAAEEARTATVNRKQSSGAGRALQVVPADPYSAHPCGFKAHGSQAKREHWLTGGVGDVPADVSA